MLNTVNYKTGKMFTQSKRELNQYKVHCNHIFDTYGLDPIKLQPEAMVDYTKHFINDGFDCIENINDIINESNTLNTSPASQSESNSFYDTAWSDLDSIPDFYGYDMDYKLNNSQKQEEAFLQEVDIMDNITINKELPAPNAPQLPEQIGKSGLILDYSKNVNVVVPNNYTNDDIAELINNIEPISEQEKLYNAKTGILATAELQNRGFDVPVYTDSSLNINLTFDDIMDSDIVDIHFDEEK